MLTTIVQEESMKKLYILCLFALTFGVIYISPAFATDVKEMTIICEEWKGYTNKDGTGVYWEVVKAVFEPAGIKVITKVAPWKRAEYMVKSKKVDAIVGDYYYKDRDGKDYVYPKWHLSVEDDITVLYKNGTVEGWEDKGVKSLAGKKVAWIRGYDFDKSILKDTGVTKSELTELGNGIQMLNAGRIDAIVDYKTIIVPEAKKVGVDLSDFTLNVAQQGNKLFVVFANSDKAKALIKVFDERMGKLAQSGEVEAIYKKWGFGLKKFGKDRF
jgi:polar amino acid transport system substrate-binding protein